MNRKMRPDISVDMFTKKYRCMCERTRTDTRSDPYNFVCSILRGVRRDCIPSYCLRNTSLSLFSNMENESPSKPLRSQINGFHKSPSIHHIFGKFSWIWRMNVLNKLAALQHVCVAILTRHRNGTQGDLGNTRVSPLRMFQPKLMVLGSW